MTRALSSELRCPVCQGLSLADSPSELALEMRDVIKDQLREGKSPEQVRQYFIGKYGEWILLEPQPHGLNLIVYVLPVLAVAGGLLLIWRAVRKWTTPAPGNPREIDARTGSPDA
jgi:cytochrome c-type biogenesis protein CcmH